MGIPVLSYLICSILLYQTTMARPGVSTITMLSTRVNADEECIRTSQYKKPQSGYVCKDMGQCYQYRCGAIARHCSKCGDENAGPCIDYSELTTPAREKRTMPPIDNDLLDIVNVNSILEAGLPKLPTFPGIPVTQTTEPMNKLRPVLIETIGNAIVHIRVGDSNCAGFVAKVNGENGANYVVMTAAQCLIKFDVTCKSERSVFGSKFTANLDAGEMIDGFMTYQYNHSSPCFGDYDADVSKVIKGYRSYAAVVTSYTGDSFTFPLNSDHVIVPRDYMECQDCRNDFGGIKLSDETAERILRGAQAFILDPDKNPIDLESDAMPNFVTVQSGYPPSLLRRAADVKFCTINHATNQKMCFNLPLEPMHDGDQKDLMVGTPVFLVGESEEEIPEYRCIGIFTGYYSTFHKNFSINQLSEDLESESVSHSELTSEEEVLEEANVTTDVMDNDFVTSNNILSEEDLITDAVQIHFTRNGAVRVTRDMVNFLETLLRTVDHSAEQNETDKTRIIHPNYDCFSQVENPTLEAQKLCLCALGWSDEGSGCEIPVATVGERCTLRGSSFSCEPRMDARVKSSREVKPSIIQEIIVPGTVEKLDLRGQQISDVIELREMLRHLIFLKDLFLDYNELTELPEGLFDSNRNLLTITLKHNKINLVHSDTFRTGKNLLNLNMASNQLRSLPAQVLHRAPNLLTVSFQNNKLSQVSPKLFQRSKKLSKIYLGSNMITSFPGKLLRSQVSLTELWMNQNLLTSIPKNALQYCSKLTLVDFSRNRISAVSKNLFDNNIKLKYVNLNYNRLRVIPRRLFTRTRSLASVSLLRNPLTSPILTRVFFKNLRIPLS